jgi:hypothetical protein
MSAHQMGSELRMLAAGLLLGRLVLRKPPAPAPVVVRIAEPAPAPKPRRKRDFFTTSALGIAIVSAVVSGVISFLVAHYQSQGSARQATATQQVQEVIQLEADIKTLYLAAIELDTAYDNCIRIPKASRSAACSAANIDNLENPLIKDQANVDADLPGISDDQVRGEAFRFETTMLKVANAILSNDNNLDWIDAFSQYESILTRCGQLIQGQT